MDPQKLQQGVTQWLLGQPSSKQASELSHREVRRLVQSHKAIQKLADFPRAFFFNYSPSLLLPTIMSHGQRRPVEERLRQWPGRRAPHWLVLHGLLSLPSYTTQVPA